MDVDWKARPLFLPLSIYLSIGHNFTNRGAGNDAVSARSGAIIANQMNISVKKKKCPFKDNLTKIVKRELIDLKIYQLAKYRKCVRCLLFIIFI